jgi:hypothetical protein
MSKSESEIPPSRNFGLLTLKSNVSVAQDVTLENGYRVLRRPPMTFPKHWTEWLGSLRADQLRESRLTILATGDEPAEELDLRAQELLTGILLHGSLRSEGGMVLAGDKRGGESEIRRVTEIRPIHIIRGALSPSPSLRIMGDVWRISQVLRSGFRANRHAFPRITRGLQSWNRGIYERVSEERLHEFVRALDAVMVLPQGEGKKKFIHRGLTFIGRSEDERALLLELYNLRSCIEHMNDVSKALGAYPPEEQDAVFLLRCFQVEEIVREVYRRLLLSDELRDYFSSDEKADSLWRLKEAEQQRLWGDAIDLDSIAKTDFLDDRTAMPPTRLRPPASTDPP